MTTTPSPLQIGIDLRLHAYAPGGISRYARRLARGLTDLVDPERLTLIYHRRESQRLDLPGVRHFRAWTPPHHRLERWMLGTEISPLRLDVFHSTDFIPPAWGARCRVTTIHDLSFLHYPEYLTADARRYYNQQITWAVEHADAIIADSEATQQDLQEVLHVAPKRISVVHLAADDRFRLLPSFKVTSVLKRYGIEPDYLLFVGVWEPRKNLPGLLEALALLHARGQKLVLVIAGRPGWLFKEIFEKIEALHLEPWVRFIEQPSADDLVALYNGALALVMPSFYEGFGLPVLEAMQCGTPVIASRRASLPEIVGDAGILVNPEDLADIAEACQEVAADPVLQRYLHKAGLLRAKTFDWKMTAEKTLAVYEAAIAAR